MADVYRHGIYSSELPTTILPTIDVATPTVVFGTAPIHKACHPVGANVPTLCMTLAEFTDQFGWSNGYSNYTLCEAAKAHFQLFGVAPVIFVNVLDKTAHTVEKTQTVRGVTSPVYVWDAILLNTLEVKTGTGSAEVTLDQGIDYTAEQQSNGDYILLTIISQSKVVDDTVKLSYSKVDPSLVTASDIIGGVDITTGKNTGMECIEEVYPRTGLVPGTLIAPKFSTDPVVAAMLKAKAQDINGVFKAIAIADISTAEATKYTAVPSVKDTNNLVDPFLAVTWPKVGLGNEQYHLSTQLAALMGKVDAAHDNIPYKSPSNENLQCDKTVLADGTNMFLGRSQANYLNGQGVITALNFIGGWKAWGSRMSAYPSTTDVKDAFLPIRRMFNWIVNTLVVSFWSKIDEPINKRLVESVNDSANIWLNGLAARGAIIGGRVEFREEENPTTDLLDGKIKFHVYIAPPPPARDIEFILEYDPSYMSTLFE